MSEQNQPAPSASALLLEARTSRELSLDQVSQQTRIPRELIQALEEKNWSALPGAPYARAFCKTLAIAYELDPELVLSGLRYDMGLKSAGAPPRAPVEIKVASGTEESESSRTPLILALILAVALLILLAATRLNFKPGAQPSAPIDSLRSDSAVYDTTAIDSDPTPGIAAAAALATAETARKTATLKLADTSKPAFLLYMRQGMTRIRKKNLTATDTLEFNPDTTLYVRNLSRQTVRLSGTIRKDSLSFSFFRVLRRGDSAVLEPISENTWNDKAQPILDRKKSLPRR